MIRPIGVLREVLSIEEFERMFPFYGQTALITGSARGLGEATARVLGSLGARVIITDIKGAEDTAEILRREGYDAHGYELDVTSSHDCDYVVNRVVQRFGSLEILVANAGISISERILNMDEAEYLQVMDVIAHGSWRIARAAMPHMMKAKYGRIIFISSVIGLVGKTGLSAYGGAKAALIAFARALAQEGGKLDRGITANVVAPGYLDTELLDGMPDKDMAQILARTIFGRLGTVEEVAEIVQHLALRKTSFTTGSVYVVDGGYTLL